MTSITEKIAYWYIQFLPYRPNWTLEEFKTNMKILELQEWYPQLDQSFIFQLKTFHNDDVNFELAHVRTMKNYTFKRINEWIEKFKKYEPNITRENFLVTHNICANSLWNHELEKSIQTAYNSYDDIERLQWFNIFVSIWPDLHQEQFNKLFPNDTDFQATFDIASFNIKLFCKLMNFSYDNNINKSYNRMIHELDISVDYQCDDALDETLIKTYFI